MRGFFLLVGFGAGEFCVCRVCGLWWGFCGWGSYAGGSYFVACAVGVVLGCFEVGRVDGGKCCCTSGSFFVGWIGFSVGC